MEILIFEASKQRFAVPIADVVETVRAVAVTPLPTGPSAIVGMINYRGRLIAVLDLRAHFGLPKAELSPDHHFVVASCGRRLVALHVDRADCVLEVSDADLETAETALSDADLLAIAKLPQGLVFILNLETLFSEVAAGQLDEVISLVSPKKPLLTVA